MNIFKHLIRGMLVIGASTGVNAMDRPVSPHDILSSLAAALDYKESIQNQTEVDVPGRMSPAECKAWKRKIKIAKRQRKKNIDDRVIAPLFRPMSPTFEENKKN